MPRCLVPTLCVLAACSPQPLPAPPHFRLSAGVRPLAQDVQMHITPGDPRLHGVTSIALELDGRERVVWLHASGLTITGAWLDGRAAKVHHAPEEMVGFERDMGPGRVTLRIAFTGQINTDEDAGVFSEQDAGRTYVFTQFEATYARRAFPCFDEPRFKVPWRLQLVVPAGMHAFSNADVEAVTETGGEQVVRFGLTQPLPSYLVAFSVGPFDTVSAGTRTRVIVPAGRAAEARFAAAELEHVLSALEQWLDIPYPFGKLDLLIVPHLGSYAAMEHPGLVTMAANVGLAQRRSFAFERTFLALATHELAHQWFGNYVTTAWWDDLWLNEALASWMEHKALRVLRPSWDHDVGLLIAQHQAMQEDWLTTARPIHRQVRSTDDIVQAFDEITYAKGQAVLAMFEQFVGEQRFRSAIQRYLRQHAFSTVKADDFVTALPEEVRLPFRSFLQTQGVPSLSLAVKCSPSGAASELTFELRRFLPLGSKAEPTDAPWTLPVCLRDLGCHLVSGPHSSVKLSGCPTAVVPHAGGTGYYHVRWPGPALMRAMRESHLSPLEQMATIDDVQAGLFSGDLALDAALRALQGVGSTDAGVVAGMVGVFDAIPRMWLSRQEQMAFAMLVRQLFGKRAAALGIAPRAGDSAGERMLRGLVVPLVATVGADSALNAQAKQVFFRALKATDASPDALETAAPIVGAELTAAQAQALIETLAGERDVQRRQTWIHTLQAALDPAVASATAALVLDERFDAREVTDVLAGQWETESARFAFVRRHVDAILARVPGERRSDIIRFVGHFCDGQARAEVDALWRPRLGAIVGGEIVLAKTLEAMDLCTARKAVLLPQLQAYFAKRPR